MPHNDIVWCWARIGPDLAGCISGHISLIKYEQPPGHRNEKERSMQAEAKALKEDESQRKERRRVDKFITLQVQQISATQQQARHLSRFPRPLSFLDQS